MDFGALPPEINSGRMYAGPRSGPMLAAAAAWDGLAADLDWAATSYGSAIADLTSISWVGPASASMVAAATPYVAWMSATAAQAQQTAIQAKVAVAAYEAAFAMTVPPPVIAANRALLMSLIATNILGQNTPAIAATEAHYAEMWAQDAAAMYGYAGASAAASTVTPFTAPQQTTNPGGLANQVAAVTQAGSTPAQAMASNIPQLISASAVPNALHGLASTSSMSSMSSMSAGSAASSTSGLTGLLGSLSTKNLDTLLVRIPGQSYFFNGIAQFSGSIAQQLVPGTAGGAGAIGSSVLDAPSFEALADLGGLGPASVSASVSASAKASVLAGMGKTGSIGGMSVPQGWAAGSPAVKLAAAQLPMAGINASPAGGPAGLLRGVPLAGAGAGRRAGGFIRRYGFRHKILRRPPMAG